LRAAIAAQRTENIAGETLRMDSHQGHGFFRFERRANFAANQRDGFIQRSKAAKAVNREAAVAGREFGVRDFFR